MIDFKYPRDLNLSIELVSKILVAHTLNEEKVEEVLELDINEKIILSYCDKSKVKQYGQITLILIIHEKEKIKINDLKQKLISFGQSVLKNPKELRNDYILTNKEIFFRKTLEKKILILGRAGSGKTSLKKVIFEGYDPKDLLLNPIEPTRGLSPNIYSWLDLNVGFFDSSGQELNELLENKTERRLAFQNANIIIYLFDYSSWNYNKDEIIKEIKKVQSINENDSYNAQIVLFNNKIDLVKNYGKIYDLEISNIKTIIKEELNLPIYFTSIHHQYLFNAYKAFCEILGMVSPESKYLKNLLDTKIKNFSQTLAFITNSNHSIVAQSISADFDFNLINHIHRLTAQFNQSFSEMVKNDNINYFLMSSYKGMIIIMKHLNLTDFDVVKIICVSQSLSNEKLMDLAFQFGIKIEKIQTEY